MARRATRYAKLRRNPFEHKAAARGLETQTEQARALDVITSEHHRALNGHQQEVSGFYVIQVLKTVGTPELGRLIDELFEVGRYESVAS